MATIHRSDTPGQPGSCAPADWPDQSAGLDDPDLDEPRLIGDQAASPQAPHGARRALARQVLLLGQQRDPGEALRAKSRSGGFRDLLAELEEGGWISRQLIKEKGPVPDGSASSPIEGSTMTLPSKRVRLLLKRPRTGFERHVDWPSIQVPQKRLYRCLKRGLYRCLKRGHRRMTDF